MTQRTRPKIWPTEKSLVVSLVPAERCIEYAVLMNRMVSNALLDLGWPSDAVEMIGLISDSAQHGTEGICFLDEHGIESRQITLLMLWGDTAESVGFDQYVSAECGIGAVILPSTGVILPTVRMPSLDGDWWDDPLHQEYAAVIFTSLIQDGRAELDGTEPHTFVVHYGTWN